MRFFKAFNLLHRRTRSATFVPGGPHCSIGSAGPDATASISLFDLVTARKPFTEFKDDHWWIRRSRDTNSLTSIQPSLRQGNLRLVELVDFWTREHSKIQGLLECCHRSLLQQSLLITSLERKVVENTEEIARLRISLSRCTMAGSSVTPAQVPLASSPATTDPQVLVPRSTDSPTSDQYSSALRMTLQTRKALKDQKKITNYWKNAAVSGGHLDTVTPSVSAISSIREALPAHRQAAVEALMVQRSSARRNNNLKPDGSFSTVSCSASKDIIEVPAFACPTETMITLPPSSSRSSQFSRLEPLASELLKHEVNSVYGSNGGLKRLSSSLSFLQFHSSVKTNESLTQAASYGLSINSFGDLNTLFQVSALPKLLTMY